MAVLITGANRGIGRGLFDHYSHQNTPVFGTSRRGDAPFIPLDVTDPAAHAALSERLSSRPIDLLICNAGVYLDKTDTLPDGFAPDMWAATFAANVTGVFLTIQTLLGNLKAAQGAKIAIISSNMASHFHAPGGSYIYRASKAAVLNLGRNLAADLRNDGIAVGIYHPGWVRTDMGGGAASISVAQSVAGLTARFDELSLASTGCFLGWDASQLKY